MIYNTTGSVTDTHPSFMRLMYQFPPPNSQFPIPAIPDAPEDVRQSANIIVRMMVESLCKNAGASRMACYYFNLTASGGFSSDDWLKGVHFATILAWYLFKERVAQGVTPQACQAEAAATVLAIKISEAVGGNAVLFQQLTPQEQNEARQLIDLGSRYRQALNVFLENIQRASSVTHGLGGVIGEVLSGGTISNSYNTTGGPTYGASYNDAPRIDMNAPVTSATKIDMTYASRLMDIEPEPTQNNEVGFGSSYSGASVSHQPTVIHLNEQASITPIETATPVLGLTEADWKPSIADPFKAFVWGKDLTVEYIEHEGFVLSVPIFKGEDEMINREELAIPSMCTAMQSAIIGDRKEEPLAIVSAGMDLVVAGIRHIGSGEDPEHAAKMAILGLKTTEMGAELKDIGYAYSMNHAISLARAAALAQKSDKEVVYCTTGFLVHETVIVPKKQVEEEKAEGKEEGVETFFNEAISSVGDVGSYQALAALIAGMIDNQTDPDVIATAIAFNKFATQTFNDVVKTKLGILGYIDSFMDDVDQFIREISEVYGKLYRDALIEYSGEFIQSMSESFTVCGIDDGEDKEVGEGLEIGHKFTMTLARVVSSYLFADIQAGETRTIHETSLPGLHAFVSSIDLLQPGDIHFITTLDGVTFKVVKSIIGSKSYTITKL